MAKKRIEAVSPINHAKRNGMAGAANKSDVVSVALKLRYIETKSNAKVASLLVIESQVIHGVAPMG